MNKSAMLMTRIEPQLKKDAEKVLEDLGIPSSVVITTLYKQIVLRKEIPFAISLTLPQKTRTEMTDEEFEQRLRKSLAQAKAGMGEPVEKVLKEMGKNIEKDEQK